MAPPGCQGRHVADAQVFSGKWIVDEFTPITGDHDASKNWDGPYFGANWGFSTDPHRCSSRETRWTAQFLLSRGRLNGVDRVLALDGQLDGEGRAFPDLAFEAQTAAVLVDDDRVRDGESLSCPLSEWR
jgi:hypothetical protein